MTPDIRPALGAPFRPNSDGIDPIRLASLQSHSIDLRALKESLKEVGAKRKERFKERNLDDYLAEVVDSMGPHSTVKPQDLYTSAAGTLRRAIESAGIIEHPWGQEFNFFSDRRDRNRVIGNHDIIADVVNFVKAREQGVENENRILLIIGKPGSGKSTVADAIKAGFAEYVTTMTPALSAIKGCPINEDPANVLSLLPAKNQSLVPENHGLCPGCQKCLRDVYESDPTRFRVEAIDVSISQGVGVVKLVPDHTCDADVAYGLIAKSNRGILDISEYSKHNDNFRQALAEVMSTRAIPMLTLDRYSKEATRREFILDQVVIATTTVAEWEKLKKRLETDFPGELRRITEVYWPYVTSLKDEIEIYRKAIDLSGFNTHASTKTLESLAKIAVRTRLVEIPYKKGQGKDARELKVGAEDKLLLYDGNNTDTLSQADRRIIQKASREQFEGMKGISPTFMTDILFAAMAKSPNCVTPIEALNAFENMIRINPQTLASELGKTKDDLIGMSTKVRGEYETWLVETVRKAMRLDYDSAVLTDFETYMKNVELYFQPGDPKLMAEVRPRGTFTESDEIVVADESFMRKVEEAIAISENGKKAFREKLMGISASIWISRGRMKYGLDVFPELKKAIERKIGKEQDAEMLQLFTTLVPTLEQLERRKEITEHLKEKYDFCDDCIGETQAHTTQLLRNQLDSKT